MKRTAGYVVGLALLVLVVLVPAAIWGVVADEETEPEVTSISSYLADFTLEADGDLAVVETITVDFPVDGRHGIFRFFDTLDENEPRARRRPEDLEVTYDGRPVEVEVTGGSDRYVTARIGSADVTVPVGEHVYRLAYRVDGALLEGPAGGADSRFYWDVLPGGWRQRIDRAQLTVRLPVAAEPGVRCAIGTGASDGCEVAGDGTRTLTVVTGPLEPGTPVTLQADVDVPTPEVEGPPWTGRYDPVLGPGVVLLAAVLLAAAGAGAAGLRLARRAREDDPRFPLQYAPPDGIGPAQAQYVLTEDVDDAAYVASLLHAAERGAVGLERGEGRWTVRDARGADGWAGLDPVTSRVAQLLSGPGTAFTAGAADVEAGKKLQAERSSFDDAVRAWGAESATVVEGGLGGLGRVVVVACLAAAAALGFLNPVGMSALALVPGAFGVMAAPLLRRGSGTRRTRAGRDLWSRVGGFRRVLSTPSSKDRFDFAGREDLYTAYVPWAVALGCAEEWAAKYRAEVGAEPPVPPYLLGGYAGVGDPVGSMVSDFSSTVDSAISAYEATQSSSSSSSSGGGFSGGGGGGGGGGGSW